MTHFDWIDPKVTHYYSMHHQTGGVMGNRWIVALAVMATALIRWESCDLQWVAAEDGDDVLEAMDRSKSSSSKGIPMADDNKMWSSAAAAAAAAADKIRGWKSGRESMASSTTAAAASNRGDDRIDDDEDAGVGLSTDFYATSCPQAYQVIEKYVVRAIQTDLGQAAGLLRIFFHDCFVQGCDASILLVTPPSELVDPPNNQSIRLSSLILLDAIKSDLEHICPSVVSCADIVALSAAISVRLVGGPVIPMATGRRDSLSAASNLTVGENLPLPTYTIDKLKQIFQNHGLSATDLVALSGGHTIGLAHCKVVDSELLNFGNEDLHLDFAAMLSRTCHFQPNGNNPSDDGQYNQITVHLDGTTMDQFDNAYFRNVLAKRVIFHSDAQLLNATDTFRLVQLYAHNQPEFFSQFSTSMLKMSRIGVLTGHRGIIRRTCSLP